MVPGRKDQPENPTGKDGNLGKPVKNERFNVSIDDL